MPKLTPEQLGQPEDTAPADTLQMALRHAAEGWNVFPLQPGSKEPLFPKAHSKESIEKNPELRRCRGECGRTGHGAWDGTTDPEKIRKWWGSHPSAGIGANLGDDWIAFDVDLQHGGEYLASFPETRKHLSGRDNGNGHLIYDISGSALAASIKSGNGKTGPFKREGLDAKVGRGSYIVMPGTRHEETGKLYTIDPSCPLQPHVLTDEEVQAIFDELGVQLSAAARGASRGLSVVRGGRGKTRTGSGATTLSELLSDVPERGEGRTNDWLTRVAGHYAKMHRDKRDLYEVEVRRAAAMVDPDYEDTEKVLESVWTTEQDGHPERSATLNSGWLVGDGRTLFCQVQNRDGDSVVFDLAPYGDFDIAARGVAVNEHSHREYWVRLHWRGQEIDATISGEALGDDRAARKWLSSFGATTDQPLNAYPKTSLGVRLQRYLESQDPRPVKIVPTLGWHPDIPGFVTHDGLITREGAVGKEEAGVVADPALKQRDVAPYEYGFEESFEEARRVLEEVMSFQDPEVTSVFGAWWAACLLKPQFQQMTSIFPFFGVEAASESGKTNGFFRQMVALNGNTRGQVAPTKPVLRDSASANRNGIVWVDDLDDLSNYGEILRASTSNGTASKMDADRNGIRNTQIVAPILITGEQLGMSAQKALADRAVLITAPSPVNRMSRHQPDRLQWLDVQDLQARYSGVHGLSALAGWFQKFALEHAEQAITALAEAKQEAQGRHGDKVAVLRAGARLLDALLGHKNAWEGQGEHAQRVDAWVKDHAQPLNADNTLTMEILPWALRMFHVQDQPEAHTAGRFQGIDTPVFIKGSGAVELDGSGGIEVWVSAQHLADAWSRDRNHRVDSRTATPQAIQQQLDRVVRAGSSRNFRISGSSRTGRYRRLSTEYALLVLERAGVSPDL